MVNKSKRNPRNMLLYVFLVLAKLAHATMEKYHYTWKFTMDARWTLDGHTMDTTMVTTMDTVKYRRNPTCMRDYNLLNYYIFIACEKPS